MRVSVIQMQVQMENKSANLAHAKDLIERSCLDTPDIILLPETFNVGFFPAEPAPLADAMEQGKAGHCSLIWLRNVRSILWEDL